MLLLLTSLVFLFVDSRSAAHALSFCNPADHKNPFSPSLAINTLEFPEENALPVGYNITIVCTSNASSKNFGTVYLGQPYWITFYFNDALRYIKECGGRDGNVDSEDSKVCEYSIQNATKSDSGNYTCWAYNQITCTEATLSLDFRAPSPPSFMVSPPKEMNISAGRKVTMSCEASGIPRPVVQWYKDGFPVPRENIAGMPGISTVTIGSFTTADQGKYWCEARSTEGWNRSSSTRLSLKSNMTTDRLTDEMSFYRHPESVTAFSGDQVVFMCAVTCSSVINITWLKDGMINDDGKVESSLGKENVSSVLTINSVKDENHGNYSCLAANAIGRTTSKVAVLFITGDTSKSAGVSKIIWIVPVVTAAVVTVLVILIFAIHKKFRGADLEHNQEVKELQRFPHLYVRENNVSKQISNTYVVPPHVQGASMTVESRE